MGIQDVLDFQRTVEAGEIATADAAMVNHFSGRLSGIRDELATQFPRRRELLLAALDAIDHGQHLLAIPVLLAQVDGVCKDVANSYFFIQARDKVGKRPEVSSYVRQIASSALGDAFMHPFEKIMPIGQSQKQRNGNFVGLNRHMVLHGESLDYGTPINSLKAVSLLNYVAQILSRKLSDSP